MSAAIEFKNVDIIFGDNAREAQQVAHAGASRAGLLARSGERVPFPCQRDGRSIRRRPR